MFFLNHKLICNRSVNYIKRYKRNSESYHVKTTKCYKYFFRDLPQLLHKNLFIGSDKDPCYKKALRKTVKAEECNTYSVFQNNLKCLVLSHRIIKLVKNKINKCYILKNVMIHLT